MDFLNRKAQKSDYKNETEESSLRLESELELIRRVANGEQDAFAVLYQQLSPQIFNYLAHLVRDQAIAEELIQDVFLVLWTGATRFRGQSSVKTWLFQIAHHKAVSWLRKNASKTAPEDFEQLVKTDTPEDRLVNTLRQEQVREAIHQLSVDHRAVVELAFYHELPYADIAQIMGCPVGTVKSRMSYARKYLNNYLMSQGFEK